ncbi:carboxymuconolactone decarboxylase family protein [Dyadobacter arcticus]|uniref:Peroxidase-related enzyme n=1 Tax=Dyadobacter arcticus TaxID=1078754 RepID=A0ABX0UL89_9BACT|nr:peroxidase-related enzyme [Dyadobacter arcticus]NIJ53777.1 putative peroxidase-related enzyme [Dyadobacter arcticus]
MPHIDLQNGMPGILGPMLFSPHTAAPMNLLANALMQTDEGLSRGERELIATYVSSENDCFFCQTIHGAIASAYLGDEDWSLIRDVKNDYAETGLSGKMKALLAIAGSVQKGGKNVTPEQVEKARENGADDRQIHDTVLIAAAFCMFNRYVDGLATTAPTDPEIYRNRAKKVISGGYSASDGTY